MRRGSCARSPRAWPSRMGISPFFNLKIAVDSRRRLPARPRTRRRGESRVARDCVGRGGSSSEGLGCFPCCHLGRHLFVRPSREPPRPTQTFSFRRAAGHEPGLRPTRTHCLFTCLACRPPRAERSWSVTLCVLAAAYSRAERSWSACPMLDGGLGYDPKLTYTKRHSSVTTPKTVSPS